MAILNYTTKIDVEKTVGEIQRCLSAHGASAILTDYKDGIVSAISFKITIGETSMGYRLPTDWKPILKIMEDNRDVPRRLCTREQAVRVAWRIIKVWIDAQMALIETKMVQVNDVFLPYTVMKNGKTLAESIKTNPQLLLN